MDLVSDAYQERLSRKHARYNDILVAIQRYEQVCRWPPHDYLNATPQTELTQMWLVEMGKGKARKAIEDAQVSEMKRATSSAKR